jgi:hypothetical protein
VKRYRFAVTPECESSQFPIDMLRYDSCWPAQECDSNAITRSLSSVLSVQHAQPVYVASNKPHLTVERWRSFGWIAGKGERIV